MSLAIAFLMLNNVETYYRYVNETQSTRAATRSSSVWNTSRRWLGWWRNERHRFRASSRHRSSDGCSMPLCPYATMPLAPGVVMIWREKRILLIVLGLLLAANTVFFFTYRVRYEE